MLRDRSKQGANAGEQMARERKRGELFPPVVRSPALEAAERQKQQTEKRGQQSRPSQKKGAGRNASMSYAAEDTLMRPLTPRKKLPVSGNRPENRLGTENSRTGVTANWRRYATPTPVVPATPAQVISN